MNKSKSKKIKFISISDIAFNLGVLESDVKSWLSDEKPKIKLDHRKRSSVSSVYMDKLSRDSRYVTAKRKSLESENILRKSETDTIKKSLKNERKKLLEDYDGYILDLESLHKSCCERIKFHHHESAITAAYLLFSKVISCLKMGALSIEHGFWYGGSVIREIEEALDLAHYFVICQNTNKGQVILHQWFRHNRAPQHLVCREAISKHFAKLSGINEENHKDLMNELYQLKSKWTHPTYSSIREITQFDTSSGIEIANIEYGGITFERKLIELTHFFRSSIWSSFQIFQLCFSTNLPLTDNESNVIKEYYKLFQQPEMHEW
jgi:hypothetical protein